jgi:phytoene synthase
MPTHSPRRAAAEAADLAACRRALRGGSHTFYAASLILPPDVRLHASSLYAFCRSADDAVDEAADPAAALETVRARLERIYAAAPLEHAADRAFAATVRRFAIPRALPEALVDGFAWDAGGRRHEDFGAVCDYGARVAGSVGAMMALVMGARSSAALARACELGVAMQLTNIARDVGEDARRARLYLPRDWMREAGLDPDRWLAAPSFDARLAGVVRRLLEEAAILYARGMSGIAALPLACRPAIRGAARLYAEIGAEIARQGYDSVTRRAYVPTSRKIALLGRAIAGSTATPDAAAAPIPAVRFLVDTASASLSPGSVRPAWWRFEARTVRVIEMFERMAERDQLGRSRP